MNAISPIELDPDPIEIDSRDCELCGCRINRHERIDGDEGPLFFCLPPDEMDLDELERRVELIRQVEVAAIFARLEAMDDPSKRLPPRAAPEPYRPAASTVSAFLYLVGLDDLDRLESWLLTRPKDAPTLLKLLENKK
jgi:hypothetical protein